MINFIPFSIGKTPPMRGVYIGAEMTQNTAGAPIKLFQNASNPEITFSLNTSNNTGTPVSNVWACCEPKLGEMFELSWSGTPGNHTFRMLRVLR